MAGYCYTSCMEFEIMAAVDHASSCESGSDYESERELSPPKSKTRKFSGAASYATKFNPDWKKEFPYITSVPEDPYRYT